MHYLWEITQPYGLRCRAENSVRKRDAACVGAGVPAKNPAQWLAPATPVFAAVRRFDTPAPNNPAESGNNASTGNPPSSVHTHSPIPLVTRC
ncbi:hypothetical protein DMX12_17510 [Pseudomonas sp. MB-090624]|nr:hypothetical protein DMX12_17510 [Pseudomonas sp. MB-090624]